MTDFVIAIGEEYEKRHPGLTWDQIMNKLTTDDPEINEIENYILRRDYGWKK